MENISLSQNFTKNLDISFLNYHENNDISYENKLFVKVNL